MAAPDRGALDAAARALRARDLSRGELARRLAAAGFEEGETEQALDRLSEVGLVDDLKLARSRAERLARRGWGNRGIAARLAAEGVGREEIDAAVAELEPERERALALAASSAATPARRLASRLRSRGFGENAIRVALMHLDVPGEPELR
jgi:regulatory protein